jgi:hypothetical protein
VHELGAGEGTAEDNVLDAGDYSLDGAAGLAGQRRRFVVTRTLPAEHALAGDNTKVAVAGFQAPVDFSQLDVEAGLRLFGALLPGNGYALTLSVFPVCLLEWRRRCINFRIWSRTGEDLVTAARTPDKRPSAAAIVGSHAVTGVNTIEAKASTGSL